MRLFLYSWTGCSRTKTHENAREGIFLAQEAPIPPKVPETPKRAKRDMFSWLGKYIAPQKHPKKQQRSENPYQPRYVWGECTSLTRLQRVFRPLLLSMKINKGEKLEMTDTNKQANAFIMVLAIDLNHKMNGRTTLEEARMFLERNHKSDIFECIHGDCFPSLGTNDKEIGWEFDNIHINAVSKRGKRIILTHIHTGEILTALTQKQAAGIIRASQNAVKKALAGADGYSRLGDWLIESVTETRQYK